MRVQRNHTWILKFLPQIERLNFVFFFLEFKAIDYLVRYKRYVRNDFELNFLISMKKYVLSKHNFNFTEKILWNG